MYGLFLLLLLFSEGGVYVLLITIMAAICLCSQDPTLILSVLTLQTMTMHFHTTYAAVLCLAGTVMAIQSPHKGEACHQ